MKNMMIMYGPRNVIIKVVCAGEEKSKVQCPKEVICSLSQKGLPLLKIIYIIAKM